MFVILLVSESTKAQRIYFYRDIFISGTITDEQDIAHQFSHITLVEWNFSLGTVDSYPYKLHFTGKYGDAKVEIPVENISRIVFEKETTMDDAINFYATVYINRSSRKLFLGKFKKTERNGPYFSFAGKSDFGDEVIKIWNIKEVRVSSVNKTGKLRKE